MSTAKPSAGKLTAGNGKVGYMDQGLMMVVDSGICTL